jgi:hypothetical protein
MRHRRNRNTGPLALSGPGPLAALAARRSRSAHGPGSWVWGWDVERETKPPPAPSAQRPAASDAIPKTRNPGDAMHLGFCVPREGKGQRQKGKAHRPKAWGLGSSSDWLPNAYTYMCIGPRNSPIQRPKPASPFGLNNPIVEQNFVLSQPLFRLI